MQVSNSIQKSTVFPKNGKVALFTVCSVNYIAKAVALGISVFEHHHDADFFILVADGKREIFIEDQRINIIWAEDIDFPNYKKCAFKYNIIEFNTSLKPFFSLNLLKKYEKMIYLDPDTLVFSGMDSILLLLDEWSTVLTPHAFSPYLGKGRPNDLDLLRFGSFNLGFFAVNSSTEAKKFLEWWHQQCNDNCFYEPQNGLGVDQKWIDLAPSFFEKINILKDPGVNLAFWNLHERNISKSDSNKWIVNEDYLLRLVHFSSFVENDANVIADKQTRYEPGSRKDFLELCNIYRSYINIARTKININDTIYSYAQFEDGRAISPSLRRFYAISIGINPHNTEDPFLKNSAAYKLAKENNLHSANVPVVAHSNFKEKKVYTKEQKIISILFRFSLYILGPDRYFMFMRFLSYFSSILNQHDVLKTRK